ncbi:tetratricopeptide repeat protein [Ancylobacter sp. TS-1]|uniref:tetratricopeptide repeat protein n=1 Tax=Ancylobacter sp. TS-1 TaxID=1850374 RepID=UPI001265B0A1|nr:tetratricopeptide repeat protein [Ancylobacter sp. TS-1]QFR34369.1 hypothetical protein GBB76_15310 [Ancylobacter sp. TS-1]
MSEAAQRAGMPLEQWLRSQLIGTAAVTGAAASGDAPGSVADLQRRIEQLAGKIDQLGAGAQPAAEPAPAPVAPSAFTPLPSTVDLLEAPIGQSMAPPAPAYSAPAPQAPAEAPASTGSVYADQRLQAAIREIDQRLEAMHLIAPRHEPARSAYAPLPTTTPNAIEAAVAEIAARQSELDRDAGHRRPETAAPREPAYREAPAREARPPVRDAISERFVRDPFAGGPFPTRAAPQPPAAPLHPSPVHAAPLHPAPAYAAPVQPAAAPFAPAAPATSARPGSVNETLAAIQGELGVMRQSLGSVAPRRAVDDLQRVVQQLAERVERAGVRDEDLRATLLALRDMIGGLKLPEHPVLLLSRIDTLERKIDIVSAKSADGATIARLQAQATEIRDLLARTLSSDSVRLLAEQVSMLAVKVSEIAANEDRVIRTAFGSLERRIDTLADKIGTQSGGPLPLADLMNRLDSIQGSLASARRELPEGMEALIKGLSDRIERIERPVAMPDEGPRFDALGRQIGELTQKIEKAVAGAEIAGQLASIERAVNDLFIQMEETRATFLAAGPRARPPGGGGNPNSPSARIKREIAGLEAAPEAAAPAPAAEAAPLAAPAGLAPAPGPVPAPAPAALAAVPPEVVFAPPPASIPKPFEPQLMRAALEELSRSTEAAVALRTQGPIPQAAMPQAPARPEARHDASRVVTAFDDEVYFHPVDLDAEAAARNVVPGQPPRPAAGTPTRTAFIAQARRAAQPSGAVPPELRSHIAERNRRKPGRWLARIRAMLLIGLCGSALAYGSWHLLAQMREGQLRAGAPALSSTATLPPTVRPAAPASAPAPEDITGSVGGTARPETPVAPAAPPPAETPDAPAALGPSSMSLPSELPGGIASQTLRAAALAGDPTAAFEIARRFMEGDGVAPNAARAAEWFTYASANGSVPAAYRLGTIYEKGMEGVPRDTNRARQLYEQAAASGNVAAMHNLGVMLASGIDGQPDYRTAAIWFTRAAERGVRDSQYNLAVLYARGFGVAANPAEAWRWFALAAARGDSEAATKRDEIATRLDARALAAARQAIEHWAPLTVDAKANDTTLADWSNGAPRQTASR